MRGPRLRMAQVNPPRYLTPPVGGAGNSGAQPAEPIYEFVISYAVKAVPTGNYSFRGKVYGETRSRIFAASRDEALEKVKALLPPLPENEWDRKHEWRITVVEANEVLPS